MTFVLYVATLEGEALGFITKTMKNLLFWAFMCILILLCLLCLNVQAESDETEGFCTKDNLSDCDKANTKDAEDDNTIRISQQDGVKVGHIEEIKLSDGRVLQQETLSLKPLVFEIKDFLAASECAHLISLATKQGLKDSVTVRDYTTTPQNLKLLDINQDHKLSINEMMLTVENSFDLYMDETDILNMYAALDIDSDDDSYITPEELQQVEVSDVLEYLSMFAEAYPIKQSRYSKQIWLYPESSKDKVFRNIQNSVVEITGLPKLMIKKSDFQVVHYGEGGHYNAHQDSNAESKTIPCCTLTRKKHCRVCRFMTILFYLNDVEEGGGTAFPVAGNETYNEQELREKHMINLQQSCDNANLIVQPERGKVVMWYNHHLNDQGWIGDMDVLTWHGGCPVKHGEKWIANFWIKFEDDREAFMKHY